MKKLGRGCLYIVISIIIILLISFISIPTVAAIPIILVAFWAVSKNTNQPGGDASGTNDSGVTNTDQDGDE